MGMRVEYEVRKLPDDFVTTEKVYNFVDDDTVPPDRWGRKRQKMVTGERKSTGGYLFVIRGKPGHSIRLTSLDQLAAFGLKEVPRMIDTESGEEVGEDGVPLTVKEQLNAAKRAGTMSGPYGTDIDVSEPSLTGDEPIEIDEPSEELAGIEGQRSVESTIDKLE